MKGKNIAIAQHKERSPRNARRAHRHARMDVQKRDDATAKAEPRREHAAAAEGRAHKITPRVVCQVSCSKSPSARSLGSGGGLSGRLGGRRAIFRRPPQRGSRRTRRPLDHSNKMQMAFSRQTYFTLGPQKLSKRCKGELARQVLQRGIGPALRRGNGALVRSTHCSASLGLPLVAKFQVLGTDPPAAVWSTQKTWLTSRVV